jgi:HPt (histidine-containing phosphotransfer) domain-containing protein
VVAEAVPSLGAEVPLLDRDMIAAVGDGMEPGVLAGFLREAVAEAERAHRALEGALGQPDTIGRVAHRLHGTAGSFGLARVGELAGAIEERVGRGEKVADLVETLGTAIAATREQVLRSDATGTL